METLKFLLLLLVLSLSVSAPICLAAAIFSSRVRDSIGRHPVIHAIWFVAGFAVIIYFVATLSAVAHRRYH